MSLVIIHCMQNEFAAPPPSVSSVTCSISVTENRARVNLLLSQLRITNFEGYRVRLSPTTRPRCSNLSLVVASTQDYVCSGFVIGRRYSYGVSAYNCEGDQEGPRETFLVHPQGIGDILLCDHKPLAVYNFHYS